MIDNSKLPVAVNCGGPGSGVPGPCPLSGGSKITIETDPSKNWNGKYKVGDKSFVSKKDATEHIKDVKSVKKMGKEMDIGKFQSLSDKHQKLWVEVHGEGKSLQEIRDRLTLDRASKDEKKTLDQRWKESADEWAKSKHLPVAVNSFCPTGKGGGIDPGCSKGGSKGAVGKNIAEHFGHLFAGSAVDKKAFIYDVDQEEKIVHIQPIGGHDAYTTHSRIKATQDAADSFEKANPGWNVVVRDYQR